MIPQMEKAGGTWRPAGFPHLNDPAINP